MHHLKIVVNELEFEFKGIYRVELPDVKRKVIPGTIRKGPALDHFLILGPDMSLVL